MKIREVFSKQDVPHVTGNTKVADFIVEQFKNSTQQYMIVELIKSIMDECFAEGKKLGVDDAYARLSRCSFSSYNEGYRDGYIDGYDVGYDDACDDDSDSWSKP